MNEIFKEFNEIDNEMLEHEVNGSIPEELQERYDYLLNEILSYEQESMNVIFK